MFLTDTTRKGLLQLICYHELCESCILVHYNCARISGDDISCIANKNRNILLRKYWSMPDRTKKLETIRAALVYLSGAKMK